jgi:uncharacterized protein
MMMRSYALGTAAILLILFSLGCSRSPRVNFYTLAPVAGLAAAAVDRPVPVVSVGPVTLPEVVDRPQLVERIAANRVEILELQRWAEPLKSEIPRLLAADLGMQLGSSRVTSYRQLTGADADYRVLLDIVRFESGPDAQVTVEAIWTIRGLALKVPKTGHSLVRVRPEGAGYDALVAAYSRALATLSADLAGAIRAGDAAAP